MKLFYYYLRNENRQPFGCVCIGIDEDLKYSRGISLCSANDKFIKKFARKSSRSRCVNAMKTKGCYHKINYDNVFLLSNRFDPIKKLKNLKIIPPPFLFKFKGEYNVNLTPFEYEIVKDEI